MGVPAALVKDRKSTLVILERLLAARWMVVPVGAVRVWMAAEESVADVALMVAVSRVLMFERVD